MTMEKFGAKLVLESDLSAADKAIKKLLKFDKTVSKSEKKLSRFSKAQKRYGSTLGGALTGGVLVAGVGKALKNAMEYQTRMAEVSTLTDISAKDFEKKYNSIVEGTQGAFGKKSQEVIKTFYDGISAGVPETRKAAKEFLSAVGEMAVGGAAAMEASGDVITTSMNAWKKYGLNYKQISNLMFQTVRSGKTTITEISASLGKVASLAAGAGVSLQEVNSVLATLTLTGVKTPEAFTQIQATISSLLKPAGQARKLFKEIGIESVGMTLKNKGLAKTLAMIDEKVRKSTRSEAQRMQVMSVLFKRTEAYKTVVSLLGDQSERYAGITKLMNKDGDQASKAFAKMKNEALEYNKAIQQLDIAQKRVGAALLPYLGRSATAIGGFISEVMGNLKLIVDSADQIERLNKEEDDKARRGSYNTRAGRAAQKAGWRKEKESENFDNAPWWKRALFESSNQRKERWAREESGGSSTTKSSKSIVINMSNNFSGGDDNGFQSIPAQIVRNLQTAMETN